MERQDRISRIVEAARARDPLARDAYLAEVCGSDLDLRRKVEWRLATEGIPDSADAAPRPPAYGDLIPTATVTRPPGGERIAHYRIVGQLGKGGMGEVYRARDERLDRDVAIKVLPADSLDDEIARTRLVREARAAAALNHPHICTVHDVGESGGRTYIAMELVAGRTLSSVLAEGPLTGAQVARYGRQLADALAHAHARGIVHRI